jgi:hypothetical protein
MMLLVKTVDKNKTKGVKDYSDPKCARYLQVITSVPSTKEFIKYVEENHIPSPITNIHIACGRHFRAKYRIPQGNTQK